MPEFNINLEITIECGTAQEALEESYSIIDHIEENTGHRFHNPPEIGDVHEDLRIRTWEN